MRRLNVVVAAVLASGAVWAGGDSCGCAPELAAAYQECAKERHQAKAASPCLAAEGVETCPEAAAVVVPCPSCPACAAQAECPECKPTVREVFVYLPERHEVSYHPAVGASLLFGGDEPISLVHGGFERRGEKVHFLGLATVGVVEHDGETVPGLVWNHPDDAKNGCKYGCNDVHTKGTRKAGDDRHMVVGATGVWTF